MARKLKTLSKKEIDKKFKMLSKWDLNKKGTQLSKSFQFPSFINGLAFVAKVAVLAEVHNHHPDIELSYGKVKVIFTTHEANGLTTIDFELAEQVDEIKTV